MQGLPQIFRSPYVFLIYLWESTLNLSGNLTKNFFSNLIFIFILRRCFSEIWFFFLKVFLTLRIFCRLERLSKVRVSIPQASSNISLNSFQHFIDKFFKNCRLPYTWPSNQRVIMFLCLFYFVLFCVLWNSSDFGSRFKLCSSFLVFNTKSLNFNTKRDLL